MEDKDGKEPEEGEGDNLRDLILQQFANLESSETSDDDSYKVRLSCILEDDESESSGTGPKDSKYVEGDRKTNKESEKGPPFEILPGENVQITDLDDVTQSESETPEPTTPGEGFAIKKLKSSHNVHDRPFVAKRREPSSDSSLSDFSMSTSTEAAPGLGASKPEETPRGGDEIEKGSKTSAEEESDEKAGVAAVVPDAKGSVGDMEVVDNETMAPIFAKVSRTYLEKTKSGEVKWEETEKIDKIFREFFEEEVKKRGLQLGDQSSLQDFHIRGTAPRVYDPPVPPETYLWEELKRLRERGGYPWTYLDKPPFDEATWKKYMEHVYEPINPPPLSEEKKVEHREHTLDHHSRDLTIPETEQQIKRIPSKASLSKKESAEESRTSEDMPTEGAQELQDRLESRFLAPSPTATSETTVSQSKTDVTSTALDTSDFEEIPAKPGVLVKTKREQMRAHAAEIQQRLRNHAGRIRNKFNNMQRRKDRIKRESRPEKSRFRLPEMHAPKINLPDRTKFKLPDRAKLHLPDSSKFHLPDRSKFQLPEGAKLSNIAEKARSHLPDRKKFHLPDKSKFHLPDKSKFHLPDKSKFHLPEKAKFHLPDTSKFHLPDTSKFHLPDTSKFHLPDKSKFTLPNKIDVLHFKKSSDGSETTPGTSKSRFDFDLKSYPKLFTKHSKDYITSSPKQTRGRTPPPRMQQQETARGKQWNDIEYADEDVDEIGMRETDSRKSESLFEKDIGYVEELEKVPTLSTKSSMSEMSDDRKKGVLEEINADEFFLRQKGISQDDIDMGQYLSREIREAFRSPDVNALAKMDYMDDENVDPTRPNRKKPERKHKSILKKSSKSDPSLSDDGYKTYPPRRPGRKSRSQSKSLLNEDAILNESEMSKYDNDDVNASRYDNIEYEDEGSEYYKSPGPAREYQHYKVPRSPAPALVPTPPSPPAKRKSSLEDDEHQKRMYEYWHEHEPVAVTEPPKPMARKKHKKKGEEQVEEDAGQLESEQAFKQEMEMLETEQVPQQVPQRPEEIVAPPTTESPVAPKRTRTRSSGSRSLRSLALESDVNRSFRSEPPRDGYDEIEDELIEERRPSVQEVPSLGSPDFLPFPRLEDEQVTDLDDPGFGYATVGKPTITKPQRQKKKPDRSSPIRKTTTPTYHTYPRRAPSRPSRNYSTLGPSRPPRHKKVSPIERTLSERQSKDFLTQADDNLDFIEASDSSKLQTEKVIEKMKGRPLPPPPRPPRQKSKGPEDEVDVTEEEKMSLSILKDDEFPIERKVTAFVHEPPPDRTQPEEVSACTQTDPLPEDFSFGTEESGDVMAEFSHEQLKIQQAFLEEMKREEEELRGRGANENDLVDAELKAEVIRQIEGIIAEEKRILERKNEERARRGASEQEDSRRQKTYLDPDADVDMGYASLDRRGHRQEPAPVQELPSSFDKLHVTELDVDTLNVKEIRSEQIFSREVQTNRVSAQEIDNRGGNAALGSVELPQSVIDQIVANIPWDNLRQARDSAPRRPQRRRRGSTTREDSDEDEDVELRPKRSHGRHPRHADEEEKKPETRQTLASTPSGSSAAQPGIPELGLQLARACATAGVEALKSVAQRNASLASSLDRELCVQAILCVAVALIAAFFLFGFDAKIVYTHQWHFQQPPNADF